MSKHKHIDKICCIAVCCALLLTVVFMNGKSLGIKSADTVMGYENRLFDTSRVHTIDIVMDDWDGFIDTCQSEEYSSCSVVIDGEAYSGVGIRGKGNTSLTSVSSMNSDRYSFKIEFDQYDSTKSYYGLDKLSLNNLIQDNTYMKDYLVYQMMGAFGADAPLCSYVYITVNGEDWGLYLAVEGVENAFLQRNYGSDYGELYKPDSMSFGGGRGNGKDFDFSDFDFSSISTDSETADSSDDESAQVSELPQGDIGTMPDMAGQMPENIDPSQMPDMSGQMPDMGGQTPESFEPSQMFGGQIPDMGGQMPDMGGQMLPNDVSTNPSASENDAAESDARVSASDRQSFSGGNGKGGMGSNDVKLQYIDDEPDSYSNIFNNAKTDVTDADKARLINSLKALSEGKNLSEIVDIDEVIRYFVVHNFVVNGDSYTGSMIHNYYLYEEDGQLSMIPWDYNLAFGTFMGSDSSGSVNDPIDSPVSGGTDDRPMIDWIFSDEEYTELYHQYFSKFISEYFDTGYVDSLIADTAELIAPYVEKDPTKFCTYEEFKLGSETIREFCRLRAESVKGQLDGTIPSTSSGQSTDSSVLVDASAISVSAMGTMGNTMGGGFDGGRKDSTSQQTTNSSDAPSKPSEDSKQNLSEAGDFPSSSFGESNSSRDSRPSGDRDTSDGDASSVRNERKNQFSGQMPGTVNSNSSSQWILLAVSVLVLAVGLIIVCRYKR